MWAARLCDMRNGAHQGGVMVVGWAREVERTNPGRGKRGILPIIPATVIGKP